MFNPHNVHPSFSRQTLSNGLYFVFIPKYKKNEIKIISVKFLYLSSLETGKYGQWNKKAKSDS